MNFFNSIQGWLEKHVQPFAEKLNKSDAIKAMSGGMMYSMPITLGVCILAILLNLPIPALQGILNSTGLAAIGNQVLNVTMNMLGVYIVACIGYSYANAKKMSGMTSAVICLAVYLIMLPITQLGEGRAVQNLIDISYMGSKGIFVAILIGMFVSILFCWLMPRVGIKLPDSVPPMVMNSLTPTFAAMIIFLIAFIAKWALTFTSFGNLFDLVNTVLAAPIMNVGSSPWAIIFAYTFSNLLWFFGVHPSAIMNIYSPAISYCMLANLEAFQAGTPASQLPHLAFITIYACMGIGGSGNMIGLALNLIKAKSERFKAMFKLAGIPSLFNISEPMMFGIPVVMNPIFFIPMVCCTPICSLVAWTLCKIGMNNSLNPAVYTPWAMPKFISGLMMGGFTLMIVVLICTALATLIYYPFFKMADEQALKEEQEAA